jgi:hypothetical protein
VQFGVHVREVASSHLVPVVLRHLQLGFTRETDLSDGHEVVEPAVGAAFDREERPEALGVGPFREPFVDSRHERCAGQPSNRCNRILGCRWIGDINALIPFLDRWRG